MHFLRFAGIFREPPLIRWFNRRAGAACCLSGVVAFGFGPATQAAAPVILSQSGSLHVRGGLEQF